MAEATPATAMPNASLSGGKRKKVPGSSSHGWDSYLHKVQQDNYPGDSARASILTALASKRRCGTWGTISMAAKPETAPAPWYKLSSASVKPCHFGRRGTAGGPPG
ncbi:hypothetical protein ABBQ32_002257 [Trebouxia sp. C0010 RCD-2024]